jgi:RimJ/RimL family protein N-acetyltransferase
VTAPPAPIATSLGLLSWRPRTPEDQGLLRALFASSRRAELDLLGGDPDQERAFVDLQLRAREQHREATRPGSELAIVTLDDIAVGQLDLHRTPTGLEVLEIALVPGLRGHGLGTAALGQVLAEADAAALPVRLHVEPANPARRLYERLGFVPTGTEGIHLAMERTAPGGPVAPSAPRTDPADADGASTAAEATTVVDRPPVPSYGDLAPHLGIAVACLPDGPELELVAVDARPRAGRRGPVPYSALLAGPLDAHLEQGVYLLDLPGTGPVELFIVPLTPADGRAIYELIVS